jgi:diacylglycerol kinase (ATP)
LDHQPLASSGPVCLIYNPVAGTVYRHPERLRNAIAHLRRHYGDVQLMPTEGPKHADQLARECAIAGARLVAVAGGDGTINEAASGLIGSHVPLAVIPAGTANVLAMEVGIGSNTARAAERLIGYVPARIAVGCVERAGLPLHYFLAMAGAGLDARIVTEVSSATKRNWGKLAYWGAGFGQLGRRIDSFPVTVGNGAYRASFFLASRVKNYGGDLEVARHASLLRNDLAIVLFEGESSFRYIKYLGGTVLNQLQGMSGVHLLHATQVEIAAGENAPTHVQVDGEAAGYAPVKLGVVPDALTLMVPPAFLGR